MSFFIRSTGMKFNPQGVCNIAVVNDFLALTPWQTFFAAETPETLPTPYRDMIPYQSRWRCGLLANNEISGLQSEDPNAYLAPYFEFNSSNSPPSPFTLMDSIQIGNQKASLFTCVTPFGLNSQKTHYAFTEEITRSDCSKRSYSWYFGASISPGSSDSIIDEYACVGVQAPTQLSAQHPAFSPGRPNRPADGRKDTNTIHIAAEGPWTLKIDGRNPVFRSGNGPADIVWDGTWLNGKVLGDGAYTLRLIRANQADATVQVLIDTKAPKLSALGIASIDATVSPPRYTFRFQAEEEGSGMSLEDVRFPESSTAISPMGTLVDHGQGIFAINTEVAPSAVSPMLYTVAVQDKAGNEGTKPGRFGAEVVAVGQGTADPTQSCEAPTPAPYRLQATRPEVLSMTLEALLAKLGQACVTPVSQNNPNNTPFKRIGSTNAYRYYFGFGLHAPNSDQIELITELTMPGRGRLESKSYPGYHFEFDLEDPAVVRNDRAGNEVFTWDGFVKNEATGQMVPAKTGKYDFSLQLFPISPLPGVTLSPGEKKNLALPVRVINHDDGEFFAPALNYFATSKTEVNNWYQRFANKQTGRLGSAGDGWSWHHIIERDMWEFVPMDAINATKHLIRVRNTQHAAISRIYTSIDNRYNANSGLTVRAWLKSPANPNRGNVSYLFNLGQQIVQENSNWQASDEEASQ